MKNPKSILVTGCAGFIGSNFVSRFKNRFPKTKISGIDDFSTGRKDALDKSIQFYEGTICDEKLLDKIFKKHKPEYVFHFAAMPRVPYSVQYPAETSNTNILGTVLLLEKSRDYRIKRFVYSSSSSIYGDAKALPTKENKNPPNPASPYALQKYTGELFCKIFSDLYGLDTISLRYFNIFGPGQYGGSAYNTVICNWLEGMYFPKKQKPFLDGDGKQSRDFYYVDNVVEANISAMKPKRNFKGEVFNIGSGEKINLLSVKKLIEKYTDRKLEPEKRPARLGDVRHTQADISKAKKLLGYLPKITFKEGLEKTIEWFKQRKK